MDNRIVGIATMEADVADSVLQVIGVGHLIVAETVQHQREVNAGCSRNRVGPVRDEVLVETVITRICQQLGDTLALIVEGLQTEGHSAVQATILGLVHLQNLRYHRILYVVIDVTERINVTRMNIVRGTQFTSLRRVVSVNRRTQVTHILNLGLQTLDRQQRLCRIVEHRSLADVAQHAVDPPRRVASGERIGVERYLDCRKPSRITGLTDVIPHLGSGQPTNRSVTFHLHLIQQIFAFSDIFRL